MPNCRVLDTPKASAELQVETAEDRRAEAATRRDVERAIEFRKRVRYVALWIAWIILAVIPTGKVVTTLVYQELIYTQDGVENYESQ